MKVIKYGAIIIGLVSLFFSVEVFAVGNASKYIVTVQTIQLKNSAGNWVTIASPNQAIDIAAVGAGAVAGSFLNDASIPVGDYVNFKVTISENMTVAGSDGANYTRANGSAILTGSAATSAALPGAITTFTESAETWNNTAIGDMTYQINLHGGDTDDYIEIYGTADFSTITVKKDSIISMWVDFDTAGTIYYAGVNGLGLGIPADGKAMYFLPPGQGTAFSITVDGTTTTITAANMTMDF